MITWRGYSFSLHDVLTATATEMTTPSTWNWTRYCTLRIVFKTSQFGIILTELSLPFLSFCFSQVISKAAVPHLPYHALCLGHLSGKITGRHVVSFSICPRDLPQEDWKTSSSLLDWGFWTPADYFFLKADIFMGGFILVF